MLERVQRAWDRLHHRPLLYRRVGVGDDDATVDDDTGEVSSEDWQPMMTASMYSPGPDGELVVDCRHRKAERRPSTDVVDDGDWCSLTLGRAHRRCRCATVSTDKAAMLVPSGDGPTATNGERHNETLPRFKSPLLGRRLRSLVGDDHHSANVASGSASCPGSPRDIARLSAVVGRRLQLGLSPRLSTRQSQRRADVSDNNSHRLRQVFAV